MLMPRPALRPTLRQLSLGAALLVSVPAHAEPLLDDAKLLLTNGVTTVEGASGGGLAT